MRIQTDRIPTYWNDTAAAGTVIGTLGAVAAFAASAFVPFISIPIAAIIGASIGGSIGKHRMEKDLTEGRELKRPSFFNKKIFSGALKGLASGIGISAVLGVASSFFVTVAAHSSVMMASLAAAAAPVLTFTPLGAALFCIALAAPLALTLIGAIKGGFSGRRQMQRDVDLAYAQAPSQDTTPAPAQAKGVEFDSPTPARTRSFAADVEKSRACAPGANITA